MNCSRIEIALPSDQNYFPGLLVTVYSMAKNAACDAELSFNILDGGIDDQSFSFMESAVVRVHKKSTFRRIKINEQDFSKFPSWKGNRMTYVRYLLPTILPDSEFVIYADSDCMWLADIAEIWKRRDANVILQGVHDEWGDESERPWFEQRNLRFPKGRYFCNGLILINLRLFREERIVEQATQFIEKFPDIQYADQSAFNYVIGDRVVLLPDRFNVFTRALSPETVSAGMVLHFANDIPWIYRDEKNFFLPPYKERWCREYAEAVQTSVKKACSTFGYKYNSLVNSFWTYVLPRRHLRHLVFVFMVLIGKRKMLGSLRGMISQCVRIPS
jgi:lipopolysaccharide biosynthesis glycosyltransferase